MPVVSLLRLDDADADPGVGPAAGAVDGADAVVDAVDVVDGPLELPRRIRAGDAAADLPARHDVRLAPGARELVPTGFAIAVPEGCCGLILPRSGLALEHGVTVLNAPGLIDAGYRGELKVLLWNTGGAEVHLRRGQRIAQLLVVDVGVLDVREVDELPPAPDDRGVAGFGSSGGG